MIEKLWCQVGEHEFERESKRGRKPLSCEEHTPTPAPKSAAELNEAGERLLRCDHDGHSFWAPVQRGRPPRFCPKHQPPKPLTARQRSGSLGAERAKSHSTGIPTVMPTIETWCKGGQHSYQRERKRGKPPLSCPEHALSGAIERKGELDQEKKEKAQKGLQDQIARFSARVQAAEIVDRDAMTKLQAAGGVKTAEEEFKIWLRANTALLHEVESLRARERKLIEL